MGKIKVVLAVIVTAVMMSSLAYMASFLGFFRVMPVEMAIVFTVGTVWMHSYDKEH